MQIIQRTLAALLCCASFVMAEKPVAIRIYIEPQEGFESYISAAIVKKNVPVVVTQNKQDANFVIMSTVITKEESTAARVNDFETLPHGD